MKLCASAIYISSRQNVAWRLPFLTSSHEIASQHCYDVTEGREIVTSGGVWRHVMTHAVTFIFSL